MRRTLTLCLSAAVAGLVAGLVAAPPGLAASAGRAAVTQGSHASLALVTITIRTVPPLPGVRFLFDGQPITTDASGAAAVTEPHNFSMHTLTLTQTQIAKTNRHYDFARWAGQRDPNQAFTATVRGLPMRASYTVTAGFTVSCPVSPRLVEQTGRDLAPARVSEITVLSDLGQPATVRPSGVSWLACAAPAYRGSQLSLHNMQYSVQTMVVSGTNVVHAGLERFSPASTPDPNITGYFYSLRMTAHDALFGNGVGSYALLTMPDHTVRKVLFSAAHVATVRNLPDGTYQVTVKASGASVASQEVRLSRDQTTDLTAVSSYDIAVIVVVLLLVVVGLPLLSGSQRRRVVSLARRGAQVLRRAAGLTSLLRSGRATATVLCCLLAAATLGLGHHVPLAHASSASVKSRTRAAAPAPVLFAYYYQWFTSSSWQRAKTDLPLVGGYDSSDTSVMREQILEAKSAGIGGFIVSWKDTPLDDLRLGLLMKVAAQEQFKLAMIYQGLDFNRNPLAVSRVADDFVAFRDKYARNPVFFRVDGKPLTIWSGTWAFSHSQVAQVTRAVRPDLLVLSTEKDLAGFERLAAVTDGDAYYWSSVNPATDSGYPAKLDQMSQAVHAKGEYWIAPFAPGFDARLLGGQRNVPRDNGQTLKTEYAAAVRSEPNMLGLISWNEFSENTYVEPSKNYGYQALDALRELRAGASGTPAPATPAATPAATATAARPRLSPWPNALLLSGFALALVGAVAFVAYARGRKRRRHWSQDDDDALTRLHY